MIFGFDLDGVIFNFPFYRQIKKVGLDYFLSQSLMRKKKFWRKMFYWVVRINPEIVAFLRSLAAEDNHRIVIVSAHLEEYQKEMDEFLRKNNIPFDIIYLWDRKKSVWEFKQEVITQEECDYYIDDRPEVTDLLKSCQTIHYQGGNSPNFFEINSK